MKKVALIIGSLTFCIVVLLLFELGIRFLKPEINNQDTELSLFRENAFGNSVGWKPNSSGISFDKHENYIYMLMQCIFQELDMKQCSIY
jgi:hypothetical protein